MLDRLKGRTLSVIVTNIRLVQHNVVENAVLGNDVNYKAMAADLRGILRSVASDHRLPTAWTNKVPHPYNQYEQGKGNLGKDEFRATVHDPSQPPLTTYAELLRVMAGNGVSSVSLDQDAPDLSVLEWQTDFDEKTLFAPQGTTRVDITMPPTSDSIQITAQTHSNQFMLRQNPYPCHYIVHNIASVKGAAPGSAPFSENSILFKIDTNVYRERSHLEDGHLFVNFGPATDPSRFSVILQVKIPGMD